MMKVCLNDVSQPPTFCDPIGNGNEVLSVKDESVNIFPQRLMMPHPIEKSEMVSSWCRSKSPHLAVFQE